MNIKKLSATVIAAAVLAVAAPMTGVLPDPLGVAASAASPDPVQTEYKVGDKFFAVLDQEGNWVTTSDLGEAMNINALQWICTVLTSDTVSADFSSFMRPTSIKYPSQIAGYTVTAIEGTHGAESVTVPDTVTTICASASLGNPYLKEVKFGANSQLKLIDQWAFQDCSSLTSITLPDSLEKIGYGAFLNCCELTSIDIPKNVNEIGDGAFSVGAGNESTIEMKLSQINVDPENKTFKSVDGIVFSKDGKTLVAHPAARNSGKYEIPADVNKITTGAFSFGSKLTSVTIPESVVDIPEMAFSYCTSLTEVKLPSTLKTIGNCSFEACAFTSIDIPASVTSIDAHAFDSTPLNNINGTAGSYAETFAKENGYTFNGGSSEQPSKPTDTPTTFTDDSGEKAADVEVIAKPNVIPKEAHFSVRLDDKNSSDSRVAYNCYFTYNGAEYEPTDTVTVRIPVPVAMRDIADTLKVYHLQDGKYVNMSAKVEDGYLVFDTDHFSVYVVTAENLENGGTSTPTTSDKDNPNTGITAIAVTVGVAALAGAVALVARKKRI